jgi:hypothetical protein
VISGLFFAMNPIASHDNEPKVKQTYPICTMPNAIKNAPAMLVNVPNHSTILIML